MKYEFEVVQRILGQGESRFVLAGAQGESYVVLRGESATWRSFEHIETVRGRPNPNDKWLSYVMEKFGSRGSALR